MLESTRLRNGSSPPLKPVAAPAASVGRAVFPVGCVDVWLRSLAEGLRSVQKSVGVPLPSQCTGPEFGPTGGFGRRNRSSDRGEWRSGVGSRRSERGNRHSERAEERFRPASGRSGPESAGSGLAADSTGTTVSTGRARPLHHPARDVTSAVEPAPAAPARRTRASGPSRHRSTSRSRSRRGRPRSAPRRRSPRP